jgi:hypothetical protein
MAGVPIASAAYGHGDAPAFVVGVPAVLAILLGGL